MAQWARRCLRSIEVLPVTGLGTAVSSGLILRSLHGPRAHGDAQSHCHTLRQPGAAHDLDHHMISPRAPPVVEVTQRAVTSRPGATASSGQVTSAAWRDALARAIDTNGPVGSFLTLATVRVPTGAGEPLPAARTVVFRGFSREHGDLLVCTSKRSSKVAELVAQPRAQICWYFAETREQFRIDVEATVELEGCGDNRERASVWARLSPAAREEFLVNSGMGTASADAVVPSDFALLRLRPTFVERLDVSAAGQGTAQTWDLREPTRTAGSASASLGGKARV